MLGYDKQAGRYEKYQEWDLHVSLLLVAPRTVDSSKSTTSQWSVNGPGDD